MSFGDLLKLLIMASPLELLAVFIVAGAFRLIVYGWVYKDMVQDRDDWKQIAQDNSKQNDQLLDIMESGKRSGARR